MHGIATDQFRYRAALHGLPDLPKWINLVYHPEFKLGFLYGTPPNNLELIKVEKSWYHEHEIINHLFLMFLVRSGCFECSYF